jgi:hypothetical protein
MFDDPALLKDGDLRLRNDFHWRARVDSIMDRFRRAFPEIKYDVAWNIRALNGTAWREISQRHVRLYGGLLSHRLIGIEACALLFAHETGHHYGGPPRDSIYEWMSCECQADFWAARHGVRIALGGNEAGAKRYVLAGAQQILKFERRLLQRGVERPDSRQGGCLDHGQPEDRYQTFLSGLNNSSC